MMGFIVFLVFSVLICVFLAQMFVLIAKLCLGIYDDRIRSKRHFWSYFVPTLPFILFIIREYREL